MSYRFPLLPRWLRWLAVLGVATVIFHLSIVTAPPEQPVVPAPPDLIPLDKWRHFLAYAAFGGSLAYATADWSWRRRTLAAAVIGTAVMYGIGIEFGQSFLPDRYVSLEDAYANALGGMLVLPWYVLRPSLKMTPVSEWVGGLLDAG